MPQGRGSARDTPITCSIDSSPRNMFAAKAVARRGTGATRCQLVPRAHGGTWPGAPTTQPPGKPCQASVTSRSRTRVACLLSHREQCRNYLFQLAHNIRSRVAEALFVDGLEHSLHNRVPLFISPIEGRREGVGGIDKPRIVVDQKHGHRLDVVPICQQSAHAQKLITEHV